MNNSILLKTLLTILRNDIKKNYLKKGICTNLNHLMGKGIISEGEYLYTLRYLQNYFAKINSKYCPFCWKPERKRVRLRFLKKRIKSL